MTPRELLLPPAADPAQPDLAAPGDHAPSHAVRAAPRAWIKRLEPQPAVALLGIGSWAYGVIQLRHSGIGSNGLLASGSAWFVVGLLLLLAAFLLELRRSGPRTWLLALALVGLIVAIQATVPIISGTPEWAWTYKHIGITSAFQRNGHVTDPANIYQQWPVLFAALAAIGSLAHVNSLSFAAWAPLAFELADAVLLLSLFRLLAGDRRIAWLAVLLYEGLISWVGQDYLSPQAFAYLLWLAMALIILRWLRAPASVREQLGRLGRWRAPLLAGLPPAPATSRRMRAVAVVLVATLFSAIVAAHQLTPYMALAGLAALVALDLVRPRWLVVLLAAVAGGYLALHYSLIAQQFGGLFSGNPLANAGGVHGSPTASTQARVSALLQYGLIAGMWMLTASLIVIRRRQLGRVVIPLTLAFSPFMILAAQSYGGEAIYRVYLFSAPWCALLIAGALLELRLPRRWLLISAVTAGALFAGIQGLYGPVLASSFSPAEVRAGLWLYGHVPSGSQIVLPVNDFPVFDTANYRDDEVVVLPADPQEGASWMNEADLPQVERWISGLGGRNTYIVLSHSMGAWVKYYGAPAGYPELVRQLPMALSRSLVYYNVDVSIYRVSSAPPGATSQSPAPAGPDSTTSTRPAVTTRSPSPLRPTSSVLLTPTSPFALP